jgi:hypothetical protein
VPDARPTCRSVALNAHAHGVDGVGIRCGHSVVQFGAATAPANAWPMSESGGATHAASTYRRLGARSPRDASRGQPGLSFIGERARAFGR